VVDAVIWLSPHDKSQQLREAAVISEISQLVAVLPVSVDSSVLDFLHEETLQLAGAQQLAEDGRLHPIKQASNAPSLSPSLARRLSQAQLRTTTAKSCLSWFEGQGAALATAPASRQKTIYEGDGHQLPDMVLESGQTRSSQYEHMTVSTSIADSLLISSASALHHRQGGSHARSAVARYSPMPLLSGFADPLHIPSLFRLLGLNLVASFVGLKQRIFGFFRTGSTSQYRRQPKRLPSSSDSISSNSSSKVTSRQATRPPSPVSYRPSFFCCNNGSGASKEDWSHCKAYRCRGLVIASFAIGIALFFC
jgi:hypothetical protein